MNLRNTLVGYHLAWLTIVACAVDEPGLAAGTYAVTEGEPDFLVGDGVGSEEEAQAYYHRLSPDLTLGEYTLDQWIEDNIGEQPTHRTLYKNANELGFWREMNCSQYIGRAIGGCWVRNWFSPAEVNDPNVDDQGTVTMNVSPEGFTRFYVFGPDGRLAPGAILDSEGLKFVPHVCVSCHNGKDTGQADTGAIFREFEPSMLTPAPGRKRIEDEWYNLNQTIRSANASIRTESEGATFYVDHARAAQEQYIVRMYPKASAALDVRSEAHIPPSWTEEFGVRPSLAAAKRALYQDLVAPYCMTCHRTNDTDFSDYGFWESLLAFADPSGTTYLEHLIEKSPEQGGEHEPGVFYMPQAELLFDEMHKDDRVRPAIQAWKAALDGPACEVGTQCRPAPCLVGEIKSCTTRACKRTGRAPDGIACGDEGVCRRGRCIPRPATPLPSLSPGVYVRNGDPQRPEAHVHLEAAGGRTLHLHQLDLARMCWLRRTEVALQCDLSTLSCTDPRSGETWTVEPGRPNTLTRASPEYLAGPYRLESPLDVPECAP